VIKVGLIGLGSWGKILHKKLLQFSDVKFTCRSKDTYLDKLDDVDWVVVSTPNETHFEIVSNCLKNGKNVFCEKPLTPTFKQSIELYKIAVENNVKLYVSDVQNWRDIKWNLLENNLIERKKYDNFNHSYYTTKDLLYRLTYHDIYYLYESIKNSEIESIKPIDLNNKLHFNLKLNDINIEFCYDTNYKFGSKIHHINGQSLLGDGKDDPLYDMLKNVLNKKVDFEYNKKITLFSNKFIDSINKKLFNKVAVVGGGVFGCTTAWKLAKNGYDVTLFEKNDDIISQASNINQYRLHRGYHYPRSKETAIQSQWGETSFLKEYGESIVNGDIKHYYCIAKENSKVSSDQYKKFMTDLNLYHKEKHINIINKKEIDLTVEVDEYLFDPIKLKNICQKKLNQFNVNIKTNSNFMDLSKNERQRFNYTINCTYANLNKLLPNEKQREYQFELCEKPVVKLPKKYKNKSVVIMDGPFMCIDPLGDTGLHVMGNVVHAIHQTNIGTFPKYNKKYDTLLNKGIVENPSITNIDKFLETAKKFFIDIDKLKHIGSMYTFRTVLPNKDSDDARPTLVENITTNTFNIFSGKIGTCVNASDKVLEILND